jgi:hypothetical protein
MKNFNKSGEGLNDSDMHARDLDFFENYARRDALWFWIYLCWDHGTNIPVWNLASLPEGESLDLGAGDSPQRNPQPSSLSKKNKRARNIEDDDALTNSVAGLVDVSKRALDVILANHQHAGTTAAVAHHHYPPSSQQSSSQVSSPQTTILSPARKRASDLSAFKDQLADLVAMRDMLPENLQGPLTTCISKVTDQVHDLVCMSLSDVTA